MRVLEWEYMMVTKCDLCKKEVEGGTVMAGSGFFSGERVELCKDYGVPITAFLEKHNLIKKVKNGKK